MYVCLLSELSAALIIGLTSFDVFAALYIRSGDILIMSGQSRTAFHAVPRLVKVGEENEPPACLNWQQGLFENETNMMSLAHSHGSHVLDKNKKNFDVDEQEKRSRGNCVSTRDSHEKKEQSDECVFKDSCDSNIYNELEGVVCDCNKLDFCGKSMRMKSLTAEKWRKFEVYLSKTRINVNVRQVHEKGKTMNSFCE